MRVSMQRLTRGPNWEPQEDKQLAKARVIVSTDAEVGTDQKGDTFWEKLNESGKSAEDHIDDSEVMYEKIYE
ncbi:hypothetical protein PF010_g23401 [Phytophthora fragariae]|uniref:Uncharacterized protein n=1 Tax=Phytophthora fragariae TaxID=53985 RepID=A0A6G0MYF2_9STRA|nr:hypothetical protein PF010_g23401 [Phytophthora fragariae]KAE9186781.1 hypothetical protein PF004_g22988 [Phytophthora fragariae]